MIQRSTIPSRQSKSLHFLFRLHGGFLQMVFSHFSRLVGDNWGQEYSAKHFPNKGGPWSHWGGSALLLYSAKMEIHAQLSGLRHIMWAKTTISEFKHNYYIRYVLRQIVYDRALPSKVPSPLDFHPDGNHGQHLHLDGIIPPIWSNYEDAKITII